MNDEANGSKRQLKPTYLPRLMPVGMIIILLAILIPTLKERMQSIPPLARIEPPLVMKYYSTGYASTDSLLNEALRGFDRKNYDEASRLLTKVYFYWSVQIREGRMKSYPEDLRFYLGLAEFYRGHRDKAVSLLEEEEVANRFEEKYPWYLAHMYIAKGDYGKAREKLEKVVKLGGALSTDAQKKITQLPTASHPPSGE